MPRLYWTEDRCLEALHAWVKKHGSIPSQSDWHRASADHPRYETAVKRFGAWNTFIRSGGYQPREGTRSIDYGEARRLYAVHGNYSEVARIMGATPHLVRYAVRRAAA